MHHPFLYKLYAISYHFKRLLTLQNIRKNVKRDKTLFDKLYQKLKLLSIKQDFNSSLSHL